jgi:hypothetical protein
MKKIMGFGEIITDDIKKGIILLKKGRRKPMKEGMKNRII